MERAAFLRRLRERLSGDPHPNLAHPLEPVDGIPSIDVEVVDPLDTFIRNATLAGATCRAVDDAPTFVAQCADALGAQTVVRSGDPEVADLDVELELAAPQDADLGVVGAVWGLASTGTVVFDAARAGGRVASLLPPAICVVLREEHILRDTSALFRHMDDRFPDGPPSQLILCTGPSRTGDIELVLTTGVHGPGVVWIGVLT